MEQNDLDWYLDCDPEDAPVYLGHSLLNVPNSATIVFIFQSLFDGPEIAIHSKSGLKLSSAQSRSCVYTGETFSIPITI